MKTRYHIHFDDDDHDTYCGRKNGPNTGDIYCQDCIRLEWQEMFDDDDTPEMQVAIGGPNKLTEVFWEVLRGY